MLVGVRSRASAREVSGVGGGGVGGAGAGAPPMGVGRDVRLRRLSLCLRARAADGSHPIGRIARDREDCT